MTTRRKLQIRKAESFALQLNTSIKLFNRRALPDCRLFHPQPLSLRWTRRYLNRRRQPARDEIFQTHFSADDFEQFATDDNSELVNVGFAARGAVLRIENVSGILACFAVVYHSDPQHSLSVDVGRDVNYLTSRAPTHCPGNKVEEGLSQLSLIGNDGCDFGSEFVVDLNLLLLGHARRCRTRLAHRLSQRKLLDEHFCLPCFDPGQIHQLIQTCLQLKAGVLDLLTKPSLRLGQFFLIEQDLAEAENRSQRRA